jgi:hypothetical protein
MRSDISPTDQLIMCRNKPHLEGQNPTSNNSIIQTTEGVPPDLATYPTSSSENSPTSNDDNEIIEFGPIKVKPRKKPAPTLATGRRSKYEMLSPEEEHKRDVRRARNRAAAERVRINRLNVEQELHGQINALEDREHKLLAHVQMLRNQKLTLETRLQTHGNLCSSILVSNPQNDLMPTFISNNTSTLQPIEQVNFDELFSDSSSSVQNQQNNYTNLPDDDFDEYFMHS